MNKEKKELLGEQSRRAKRSARDTKKGKQQPSRESTAPVRSGAEVWGALRGQVIGAAAVNISLKITPNPSLKRGGKKMRESRNKKSTWNR